MIYDSTTFKYNIILLYFHHFLYNYHYVIDKLLLSSKLLINQIFTKAAMVDN